MPFSKITDFLGVSDPIEDSFTGLGFGLTTGVLVTTAVAPIPVLLGTGILAYFILPYAIQYEELKRDLNLGMSITDLENSAELVEKFISKFGKLPSNVQVNSEYIVMDIETINREIDGVVKTGPLKDIRLSELSECELKSLSKQAPTEQLKMLVDAFICYSALSKKK